MTRASQIFVFLGFFAVILLVTHFYLFLRISHYFHLNDIQRRWVGALFGTLGIVTLIALPASRLLPRPVAAALDWVVFPWMGLFLLMLVVMAVTDMAWLATKLATQAYDPERRLILQKAFGIAALSATGILGGYSLWNGLRPVGVKPVDVVLKRLPKALDGLRIVQISDLHIGPLIDGAWLRQVVDHVNALKPDIIAVTGDLVDGSVEDLQKHTAPLADLSAPLGVYFITGNHEYYSGVEEWCAHVANLGLRVLRNARVSITFKGESFDLAGVDDWGARRFPGEGPDLAKALAGRDKDKALILLAHQPAAIDEAAENGVDLQLSGHTHGGQIWPFNYLVYLQQPYVKGLYQHKDTQTQIYVSAGTGFWGPPMRFGTEAEITHITLRTPS